MTQSMICRNPDLYNTVRIVTALLYSCACVLASIDGPAFRAIQGLRPYTKQ